MVKKPVECRWYVRDSSGTRQCRVLAKKIKDFRTGCEIMSARVWLQLLVRSAPCILLRRGQNVAESLHHQHSLVWGYQGQDGVKYWCRVSGEITLITKHKDFVSQINYARSQWDDHWVCPSFILSLVTCDSKDV